MGFDRVHWSQYPPQRRLRSAELSMADGLFGSYLGRFFMLWSADMWAAIRVADLRCTRR
jgi:hypothetical protein